MNRCNPVEMRKNLKIVALYIEAGIDFVPVPVRSQDHKKELIVLGNQILEKAIKQEELQKHNP